MSDTTAAASTPTSEAAAADPSTAHSGPMALTKKQEIGIAIGVVAILVVITIFLYWKKKLCFKPKKDVWKDEESKVGSKAKAGTTATKAKAKEKDLSSEEEETEEEDEEEESEEEVKHVKHHQKSHADSDKRLSRPAPRVSRQDRAAKALSTIKERAEDESKKVKTSGGLKTKTRRKSAVTSRAAKVVNESDDESEMEETRSKARRK